MMEAPPPQPDPRPDWETPVDRPPWWARTQTLTLAWWVLLVYGSLLPWRFGPFVSTRSDGQLWQAILAWVTSPRWQPPPMSVSSLGVSAWASDLVANAALYLPLGVLLRLAARPIDRKPAVQILAASFGVVLTSWLLECTQSLMPDRVASLNDVLINVGAGMLGVVLARPLVGGLRRGVFAVYRHTAAAWWAAGDGLDRFRRRPAAMLAIVVANAGLLIAWVWASGLSGEFAALPFARHFEQPYDVAGWWLGQSLLVYCLIGSALALTFVRQRARRGLGAVLLLCAGLVGIGEVLVATTGRAAADITEPLLAAAAVGLVGITAFLLTHAVRSSCRRKRQAPVEHDRRRRTHEYG